MHCIKLLYFLMIAILVANLAQAGANPTQIPLWPGGAPDALTAEDVEEATPVDGGNIRITDVIHPDLTVYLPEAENPTPAVIICPGGGYGLLSFIKEGITPAEFLAGRGVAGIVLKYRLPNGEFQEDPSIAPLKDAQRTLQIVHQHSKEWNIDPDKIGIMGFSAGGHLASTVASRWRSPVIGNTTVEEVRPNFSILVYPVISLADPEMGHAGSRRNLLGENPSTETMRAFSAEKHVNAETPPAFLVHSMDDKVVPVENSLSYLQALRDAGVPGEAVIYQTGGHGFGMNPGHPDTWPELMIRWIRLNFE